MGSEGDTNARKPHYNISMSRRTRKTQDLMKIEPHDSSGEKDEDECSSRVQEQKISSKKLTEGRCSLAQHFREEEEMNQQSLVVKPPEDGLEGVKIKKSMVRKYVKVLSHMIKVKQESYIRSWRKPAALSFKLIEHK